MWNKWLSTLKAFNSQLVHLHTSPISKNSTHEPKQSPRSAPHLSVDHQLFDIQRLHGRARLLKGLELCSWATEQVAMIIPTGQNYNNFGHQFFLRMEKTSTIHISHISKDKKCPWNTLWWTNIAMENHHAFNVKIHYQLLSMAIFNSYVKLPEGINHQMVHISKDLAPALREAQPWWPSLLLPARSRHLLTLRRHRSRAAEVHQSPMEYLGLTTKNIKKYYGLLWYNMLTTKNPHYSLTCLRVITKKHKFTMV